MSIFLEIFDNDPFDDHFLMNPFGLSSIFEFLDKQCHVVEDHVEVPAQWDVLKHEETVTEVVAVSAPSTEAPAVDTETAKEEETTSAPAPVDAEAPIEVTVTTVTEEVVIQPVEKVFLSGVPVCYNNYGAFQNKEFYLKTLNDAGDCFLRWRIQLLEKEIQKLSFNPGGITSMVQITNLKNTPGPAKWGLCQVNKKALTILQDNYPEFVVARPARVLETLLKYISPEYVPVQYGGLRRENDAEVFAADGGVSELFIKPGVKQMNKHGTFGKKTKMKG